MMPGEGGGGGGGGATVGGQSGGPLHHASHWLKQKVSVEPSVGPLPPTFGQPHPPVPETKQGAQTLFLFPSLSLYAMNMHFDFEAAPSVKHAPVEMNPDSSMQAYSGCAMTLWCGQTISHAFTCQYPPMTAPRFQQGIGVPSISHGRQ